MKKLILIFYIYAFNSTQFMQASCIAQEIEKTMCQTITHEIIESPCCLAMCAVSAYSIMEMVHLNAENVKLKEKMRKIELTNQTLLKVILNKDKKN